MTPLETAVFAVGCALIGAFIANAIWLRVFRRHVDFMNARLKWWDEHSEKLNQHCRNMVDHAENAFDLVDRYQRYLHGKIVIEDPSRPRQPKAKS